MRKRGGDSVEVYFLTNPLCPWSWAIEPIVAPLVRDASLAFRVVLTDWPSPPGVERAKAEWTEAASTTSVAIDQMYWDRVAPKTSLIACAAVKAADFQGASQGLNFLSSVRRAVFEWGEDPTSSETLLALAAHSGLKDLFRDDLGVGRYTVEEVVKALEPDRPVSENVWWFGRRKMLRAWIALADDLRNAENQRLGSPSFHLLRGKKEVVVRGLTTERDLRAAIASL